MKCSEVAFRTCAHRGSVLKSEIYREGLRTLVELAPHLLLLHKEAAIFHGLGDTGIGLRLGEHAARDKLYALICHLYAGEQKAPRFTGEGDAVNCRRMDSSLLTWYASTVATPSMPCSVSRTGRAFIVMKRLPVSGSVATAFACSCET